VFISSPFAFWQHYRLASLLILMQHMAVGHSLFYYVLLVLSRGNYYMRCGYQQVKYSMVFLLINFTSRFLWRSVSVQACNQKFSRAILFKELERHLLLASCSLLYISMINNPINSLIIILSHKQSYCFIRIIDCFIGIGNFS